ncbi:DUF11 domain-containing protein [Lysobacter sp. SG-8]|uniref:DUF11 domain-containing protein n=1 Tax=Marilutibacter penaei TaxID=2759900 RepID=A0A7W3U405_9GAMM|nr:OmpA family protein [Lysobacter penaei]MBB1088523.1 DUF11 domain-containing protein [Lysobacter penaei]
MMGRRFSLALGALLLALAASPVSAQTASNTASIAPPAGVTDPDTSNNSATDTDDIVREADLALVKSASPDPVLVGGVLTYTIEVTNNGPSAIVPADELQMIEVLPAGLSSCSYTPSEGTYTLDAGGAGVDTWTGVGLPSGSAVTLIVACTVDANAASSLTNQAQISVPSTITDPIGPNNNGAATVIVEASADLAVTKDDGSATYVPGSTTTYTVVVTNNGPSAASNVLISDPQPTGAVTPTFTSWTCSAAGGASCPNASGNGSIAETVPSLPDGGSLTYSIVAAIPSGAVDPLTNTVTVSSDTSDPTPDNNTASDTDTAAASADAEIIKSLATPNPAVPGQTVSWTLNVNNLGPSDTGVTVTDTVPSSVTGLSLSGPNAAACSIAGQVITCTVPSLSSGTGGEVTVSGTLDIGATGDLVNTAEVTTTATDPVPGNNTSTSTTPIIASSNSVAKTASPASGSAVRIGDVITYTLTTTIADSATTADIVLTDTLDAGLTPSAALPSECSRSGQVLTCTVPAGAPIGDYVITYNAVVNSSAGATVGNNVTGGDACPTSCATTHTVYRDISLTKTWTNPVDGDAVSLSIAGTVIDNAQGSSTAGAGTTPATAKGAPGATITLSEAFSTGVAADYGSTLSCTRVADGGSLTVSGSGLSGSFTMPDDSAVSCEFNNARTEVQLTLSKQWINALPGDTADLSTSGFSNDVSFQSTADSTGNNVSIGTPVTVYAGDSGTISEALSNPGNYNAELACSGNTQPVGGNNTLTIDPADNAIECTWTNERKPVNLVIQKTWLNAAIGEAAQVTATGSSTTPIELDSVADTASETDNAQFQVYAGETIVLAETFGTPANAANYDSVLNCSGTSGLSGNTLTVDASDTDITCTFTNTRRSATLQLAKAWGPGAATGDVAQIGATTGLVNNTSAFTATAPTGDNSGPAVTVFAGEQATLPEETMAGGPAVLDTYQVALSCSGGSLSGSDGKSVNTLDIQASDEGASIVCTYTNTRIPTTLTLQKVWLNAIAGDSVEVVADRAAGGLNAATVLSTASGGATQTDTGATVDIYAGDVIQMGESFTNGTSNNYDISIDCTNTSGFVLGSAGAGGTLTVGPNDGPITCTWTNDRKSAQLIVRKVWGGPSPGASVDIPASTGFTNNTPAFSSDFPNTTTVGPVEVFVEEVGSLGGESFTVGDPGDFDTTVTCDGSDTDPSNGLAINLGDVGNTVTCTYSNTFVQRHELTVDKSSASTVTQAGDVVTYAITVTNTGNVPVNDVTVTDPLPGLTLGTCTPALPADLAVGASVTCSATYTVTQADIDRNGSSDGSDDGNISNTATASGTTDGGDPVNGDDNEDVPLPPQQFTGDFAKSGALLPDADGNGVGSVGDVIEYTFTVKNTGNSTITAVDISDPLLPNLSCDASPPILPGQTVTFGTQPPADVACTGNTYTITQDDIDNQGGGDGDIDNIAELVPTGPNGGTIPPIPATDQTPIDPPLPDIEIDKTANPTSVDSVGDVVTYTFEVTNTGNVTLSDVTITDTMFGLSDLDCAPDTLPTVLAPGQSVTCTATYTVTQADIDAGGTIHNTATASGEHNGTETDDSDPADVNVDPGPGRAELVKSGDLADTDGDGRADAGEVITYTFSVNNPGPRTLRDLRITNDTLLGAGLTCNPIAALGPGQSATFSCTGNTYTVTQADIDANGAPVGGTGFVNNTVSERAEYVDGGTTVEVTDTADAAQELAPQVTQMQVFKTATPQSVSVAGDQITYVFEVENLGNVTLSNLVLTDAWLPSLACDAIPTLAPGDTATFTCTAGDVYTVTQADIDLGGATDLNPGNGRLENEATVTAERPDGTTLQASVLEEVTLPVRQQGMTLVKAADVSTVSAPGIINYTFTVTNTGNVTIHDLDVSDPTLGLSCPTVASLAPGADVSFGGAGSGADQICTGTTRTVDQATIDAGGTLDNTATATGQTEVGAGTPLTVDDTLRIRIDQNPVLDFDKVADVTVVNDPGDVITYTITGTNTGNVTLTNLVVTDPLVAATLSCTPASPIASLAPGDGFVCTGTYVATQTDFDTRGGGDGVIENTANATWDGGTTDAGADVDIAPQQQSLTIDKTAGTPSVDQGADPAATDAGDTITYTFVVTNTGNVTLSDIGITDPKLDAPATCDKVDIPATSPPDSVTTCTGVHTITQAEMDVGVVNNSATAQGTPPGSNRISSQPDTANVTLPRNAAIELTKTAGAPTVDQGALPAVTDAGDQITYAFSVENVGNVSVRSIDVTDTLMPGVDLVCAPLTLPPGGVADCGTATYTLTQGDIDAGIVTNDATATGLDPTDAAVTDDDAVDVPLPATPVLAMVKTANPTTVAAANDSVTYTFQVTNQGNVTVSGLVINEVSFSGTGSLSAITCNATSLAPQASTTCTATYAVTQADIDAGSITNVANASGTAPDATAVTSPDDDATVTVDLDPELTVTKTASLDDPNGNTTADAGEVITYTVTVQNTGNVTLANLAVTDAFEGGAPTTLACSPATLAPNDTATCTTYTHTVTQAEVDAGGTLDNVATATADPPAGAAVTGDDDASVPLTAAAPDQTIVKSLTSNADEDGSTDVSLNDTLTYTVTVTNTGNVTLPTVVVTDSLITPDTQTCTNVAPGGTCVLVGTYVVQQSDVDAGQVENTATGESNACPVGDTTEGKCITPPNIVPVPRDAELVVTKAASLDDPNGNTTADAGEVITYTVTVQNTGNVTLANLAVTDAFEGGAPTTLTCSPTTLAPNDIATCTAYTHTVTQAEVDAGGTLDNVATATADPPAGAAVDGTDSKSVPLTAATPDQTIVKSLTSNADEDGSTDVSLNDTLTYTVTVTNTGNVTLPTVVVTDSLITPDTQTCTNVAPGGTCELVGTYVVQQSDVDAGEVVNTATGGSNACPVGDATEGKCITPPNIVPVPRDAELVVTKTASLDDPNGNTTADAGEVITYTVSVQNTGNVTLANLAVTDAFEGGAPTTLTCSPTTLAPNDIATCTAYTHTVTQAEVDAGGTLDNVATATADPPAGAAVDGTDSKSVPLTAATPDQTIVKSLTSNADEDGSTDVSLNDTLTYTVTVTNTGNVTLPTVVVTDSLITPDTQTCTNVAPGGTCELVGTYVVQQSDVDAGEVVNTATGGSNACPAGDATEGKCITPPNIVPVPRDAELVVTKTASLDDPNGNTTADAGEVITYTVSVQNTGNVTLANLAVTDAFEGGAPTTLTCSPTTLAPNDIATCTAYTHTVTQAEVDAGGTLDNVATATADPPAGAAVDGTDSKSVPLTAAAPDQTIVKSLTSNADEDGSTDVSLNDTLTYTVTVTNTGNVTLPTVVVTDSLITPDTQTCTNVAPGGTCELVGTYVVQQSDVDAGEVVNTATGGSNACPVGDATQGKCITPPNIVPVPRDAELTLVKTVTPTTATAAGDIVAYSFEVTNSGNVTITGVSINETVFSGTGTVPVISCPPGPLAPGATKTCTSTDYVVTQADVNAGVVDNTAQATGNDPAGNAIASPDASAQVTIASNPALTLVKTVTPTTAAVAGDIVAYSFEVTNSGNVTVTGVSINETVFSGTGTAPVISCPPGPLAPGATKTCTSTDYVVTQADVNAGVVDNTAQATGNDPGGNAIASPDASAQVTIASAPALTLAKTATVADTNGDGLVGNAGDTITYAFSMENTGNVSLAPVTVTDPLLPSLACSVTTLDPGQTASCTATGNTYVITVADEANGSVDNTATATGDAPGTATDPTANGSASTPTTVTPAAISVVKTSDPPSGDEVAPGDSLEFTVTVTVADAALHEAVTITDTLGPGLSFGTVTSAGAFTCNSTSPLVCTLPVGTAQGSYPLVYTATVDADATGSVGNSVVATKPPGIDPDPVCTTCSTDHPLVPATTTVNKTSDPPSGDIVAPGDTLTFTLSATVSGSALTQPLTLTDSLSAGMSFGTVTSAGDYTCSGELVCELPAGTLPGTYDVVYTATVDADATGSVANNVVATNPPGGDPDPECVVCSTDHPVSRPSLETAKSMSSYDDVDGNGEVSTGDVLTYTVTATNTGNVPLANVTISDAMIDPASITCPLLAPGAVCTLEGSYTVVQADTDAGQVVNEATSTAEPPPNVPPLPPEACPAGSASPNCEATDVTPVIQRPAIATTKSAALTVDNQTPDVGNPDDVVTYTVTVTNTGNVTLADVSVADTFQGGTPTTLTCAPTTLAPGQVATCDAYTHTITEQEAATPSGELLNEVLASGDSASGTGTVTVTATDEVALPVQDEPASVRIIKTASPRDINVGDLVRYTLVMENTGDVPVVDGTLIDTPPAGFTYVDGSLTVEDGDDNGRLVGTYPIQVDQIDIAVGERATVGYLLRVGAGVRPGVHVNSAYLRDDGETVSNVATAEVQMVADPLLEDSLIIGTVFNDRDGDGWQDSAEMSDVTAQGGFAASAYVANSTTVDRGQGPVAEPDASSPLLHGLQLGTVSGRSSEADPASAHRVVISQTLASADFTDDFVLSTGEGIEVRMDAAGNVSVENVEGDAAKGLTSAAPRIERRVSQVADGYRVDYIIENEGIDERGIPGVRIATVEGLLVETDQYGRYHLVGIEGGNASRGRNFIMKIDPVTLPPGTEFVTDNPQVRRITPGVPVRFDFGVKLPPGRIQGEDTVEMELGAVLFEPESAVLRDAYLPVIEKMAEQVMAHDGGEVLIEATAEQEALGYARAKAVQEALLAVLPAERTESLQVTVRANLNDSESMLLSLGLQPVLGRILFDTDKSTIKPQYEPVIAKIAADIEKLGGGVIGIVGHADRRGAVEYNDALGMRRAKAVYEAIAERLSPEARSKLRVEISDDPTRPLGIRGQ